MAQDARCQEDATPDTFRYGIVVPILNVEEVAGSDGVAPSDPRWVGPNQSIAVGPGRSIKPTLRRHHCPPQLVEHHPCRLVPLQPELALQL